jgi:hypothetical protein
LRGGFGNAFKSGKVALQIETPAVNGVELDR